MIATKMLTDAHIEFFRKNGYIVIDGFFDDSDLAAFREAYRKVIRAGLHRASANGAPFASATFDGDEFDGGMMALEALDHTHVADIYNTTAQMTAFLRLITGGSMDTVINTLMGRPADGPLYGLANRCRIDLPSDERRTYGWHQEVFYTIPQSHFLQTWAPLIRPTTVDNGTIELCVGSHNEGIARQAWIESPGRALQIIVDDAVVRKYQTIQLEMTPGQLLVIDGHLFHRSGRNSSREVRYSLVGMYHDVERLTYHPPDIAFQYKGLSTRDYFVKSMAENGWPVGG